MIDVTTSDYHGHWDVEDIKRLCEYRDQLRAAIEAHQAAVCNNPQAAGSYADERLWAALSADPQSEPTNG